MSKKLRNISLSIYYCNNENKYILLADIILLLVTLSLVLNPCVYPGQNKDVQQVVKKFVIRRKLLDECCMTIDKDNQREEVNGGQCSSYYGKYDMEKNISNEWWIVIKLKVR